MPWFNPSTLSCGAVWLALAASPLAAQSGGGPEAAVRAGDAVPEGKVVPPAAPVNPGDAPSQSVPVAVSDLSSLNRLLPVGKTARKVTVPTIDDEGRLASVVIMGSITRIDEDNFSLKKVVLTSFSYAEAESPDPPDAAAAPEETVIRLVDALYHAPTRVLVSDRPFTIRKPMQFLTGNALHYDSASGRAVMKGSVLAVIADAFRPELSSAESEDVDEAVDESENEDENEDENEEEAFKGSQEPNQEGTPPASTPTRQ